MKLNVADRIESSAERATELSSSSPAPTDSGQQPRMFGQVGSWVAAAAPRHEANDDGPLRGTSFIEIGMGGTIKPGIARTANEPTDRHSIAERTNERIL